MNARTLGFGCMRLSPGVDHDRAIAVIRAALDGGIQLFDTAAAYCTDERDYGHNERLLREALSTRPDARVRVATKVGMTRPSGGWVPDGRAKHLASGCEASLRALAVDCIDLLLLHAPDPQVPLATSVRALAKLQRQGLTRAIGLCNVRVDQIETARRIAPIAAVQVAIGPLDEENLRNGVAAYCREHAIELIAHSPFGGPKRCRRIERDPELVAVAARHDVTPFEVALAWLWDTDSAIVPIPGTTKPERLSTFLRAVSLVLDGEDRQRLDERFPAGVVLRVPTEARRPPAPDGEVVLLMGSPGAGKSTRAQALEAAGYVRLNRDEAGGRLRDLLVPLERGLLEGERRFVLDNTYASRSARNEVIELAWTHGVAVRCEWLQTPLHEAQVNVVSRMLARHGRLLGPEEIASQSKQDANVFGPTALFRYERAFEAPRPEEGFREIEAVPFVRERDPHRCARAVFLADLDLPETAAPVLQRYVEDGWLLCVVSWQPDIAKGATTREAVVEHFREAAQRLAVPIELAICPHGPGAPVCWCRKPLPGLFVERIERHGLDPARCVLVGDGNADRTVAERLGFEQKEVASFFAS